MYIAQQSPLIQTPWYPYRNVMVVRGDLLHPVVSGNKLFKLEPMLSMARNQNIPGVISVGGRYSNHLHALAFAAKSSGLESVGLVSGYEQQELTPTLTDCKRWGMTLHFLNREQFQQRNQEDFWQPWLRDYPNYLHVNEGGWSEQSIRGSGRWWQGIPENTEVVVVAVGSGTTLAGLLLTAPEQVQIIGVPAYKDPDDYAELHAKLKSLGIPDHRYRLWQGYVGPKFGKISAEQQDFANEFYRMHRVRLDPVYTTKAFFALSQELSTDAQLRRQNVAILHTGGLQGLRR